MMDTSNSRSKKDNLDLLRLNLVRCLNTYALRLDLLSNQSASTSAPRYRTSLVSTVSKGTKESGQNRWLHYLGLTRSRTSEALAKHRNPRVWAGAPWCGSDSNRRNVGLDAGLEEEAKRILKGTTTMAQQEHFVPYQAVQPVGGYQLPPYSGALGERAMKRKIIAILGWAWISVGGFTILGTIQRGTFNVGLAFGLFILSIPAIYALLWVRCRFTRPRR